MKLRYIRPGDDLADDQTVVVRGGLLSPAVIRDDALRHHAVYGTYAVSVFALRDVTIEELAQQPPLVRFARLTITTAGAIRSAGLRLLPTGRNLITSAWRWETWTQGSPCSAMWTTG